ncbi:MAG: FAD-binding protein [Enterocloster sp.]
MKKSWERSSCLCREHDIPWSVLGNGSNLLVSDRGIKGVVIAMDGMLVSYAGTEGSRYTCGSRCNSWAVRPDVALDDGLTGFEFAAGIPGTVGGALVMNAGAYGSEMKNILESARVMTHGGRDAGRLCRG